MWSLRWSLSIKKVLLYVNFWCRWIVLSVVFHLVVGLSIFVGLLMYHKDPVLIKIEKSSSNIQVRCRLGSGGFGKQPPLERMVKRVGAAHASNKHGSKVPSKKSMPSNQIVKQENGKAFVGTSTSLDAPLKNKKHLNHNSSPAKQVPSGSKKSSVLSPDTVKKTDTSLSLSHNNNNNVQLKKKGDKDLNTVSNTSVPDKIIPANVDGADAVVVPTKEPVVGIAENEPLHKPLTDIDEIALIIGVDTMMVMSADQIAYAELQDEVVQCWEPPVGVEVSKPCRLNIILDDDSKVLSVRVVQSSGVLLFDVAAKKAIISARFPRWTAKKTLLLEFL